VDAFTRRLRNRLPSGTSSPVIVHGDDGVRNGRAVFRDMLIASSMSSPLLRSKSDQIFPVITLFFGLCDVGIDPQCLRAPLSSTPASLNLLSIWEKPCAMTRLRACLHGIACSGSVLCIKADLFSHAQISIPCQQTHGIPPCKFQYGMREFRYGPISPSPPLGMIRSMIPSSFSISMIASLSGMSMKGHPPLREVPAPLRRP